MLAEHDVGLREPVEDAVGDHGLRAGAVLLGRLEHGDDRARPLFLGRDQLLERAEQRRHVHVVPARVHDRHVVAGGVGAARRARVLEPGLLGHRQRVHVGAQPDDRPLAVLDERGDAGLADALLECDAQLRQVLRDHPGRAGLLEGQLRMPVQIDVERFEVEGHGVEPSRGAVAGAG